MSSGPLFTTVTLTSDTRSSDRHAGNFYYWICFAVLNRFGNIQYLGTEASTSSDHARIPPFRFNTLRNPALRKNSTASAERFPLRQCATISRELSNSFTRRESSPSGIKCPPRLQI